MKSRLKNALKEGLTVTAITAIYMVLAGMVIYFMYINLLLALLALLTTMFVTVTLMAYLYESR